MTSHASSAAARQVGTIAGRAAAVVLAVTLSACSAAAPTAAPETTATGNSATGTSPQVAAPAPARHTGARTNVVPVRPAQDVPPPTPPAPTRVQIPDLAVDLPVQAVGVDEQDSMELPGSADVAGWYRFGAAPASPAGATTIAAHVDDVDSVGPFARLRRATPGTAVRVRTADGTTHNYTVERVQATAKSDVVADRLFDRTGRPRLLLVTCGGEWDARAHSYSDNVVVTAVPQG
ncbi:class F sortase [Isoptericola sp. NPDC055881]